MIQEREKERKRERKITQKDEWQETAMGGNGGREGE